ncbi:MAG: PepSY domain-containing protein [Sphingobacteriaceae bacterium]|nr:MAG: PepSY domain-containing protein [Sphingobacteriaceae bacterium]
MNKRNFYKWHRVLGLIALIPVIFWTISGVSHPFMSNWFRPSIAKESFDLPLQSSVKTTLSIQQILDQNKITELRNFSLVKFDKGTYYQVLSKDSTWYYYSATDGYPLPDGDKLYAAYLARYFTQDSTSTLNSVIPQTQFDSQYQPVNRLLPVWKVSFNRADSMDIYVETAQSRMGTFNNNTRKNLLWVFEQFHTWNFLKAIGGETFRSVVLLTLTCIMFFTLISGLVVYGLYWKSFKTVQQKRKKKGANDDRFIHRYHRQIGLIVSAVMLMFVISGTFHLFIGLYNGESVKQPYEQVIKREQLVLSNLQLPIADSLIKRVALANFNGKTYYQVTNNIKRILYVDAANGQELPNGDEQFAAYLSNYYTGRNNTPDSISRIGQFTNDYGFINKRLPVQKLSYQDADVYIETTSAKLATKVSSLDRAEGLSFIFLHKFFWMTWAGKDIRDIVSMLFAGGILIVALLGFIAFLKNK